MYINGPNKQNQLLYFHNLLLTTNVLAMACMPFTMLLQARIDTIFDSLFEKSTFPNAIVALRNG